MDRLTANQWLGANDSIASPNGYTLIYQADGNLVVYDGNQNAAWDSSTGSAPGQVIMQNDGNFVMYDVNGAVVWNTGTAGSPGAEVIMQGDGNLVVYAADGSPLWASQDDNGGSWWDSITGAISGAVDAVVGAVAGAVSAVVAPIADAVAWAANAVASAISFIFALPILGRLIELVWNTIVSVVLAIVSVIDFLAALIGIRPEKRMLLQVIIQSDSNGPIAPADVVASFVSVARMAYKDQANIKLIPAGGGDSSDPMAYILTINSPSSDRTLTVCCDACAFAKDAFALTGSAFASLLAQYAPAGFRRLLGYGAPIIAFAVSSFTDGKIGCSNSWLTNYVLVNFGKDLPSQRAPAGTLRSTTLAHECGHANWLWHVDPSNLMQPAGPRSTDLSSFQIALMRTSRHVTYF